MLDDLPETTRTVERSDVGPTRSLKMLTALPEAERDEWVRRFLPRHFLERYQIDPDTFLNAEGERVVKHGGSPHTGEAWLSIWRRLNDRDPLLYGEARDTPNGQIELTFLATNDPDSPRFDVDTDAEGRSTMLGKARRNIAAEIEAMNAGLAPGQVRKGLGLVLKEVIPHFERFLQALEHEFFFAYPLGYHNAILMERWGFDYLYGGAYMSELNDRFQPGGDLYARLDGSTPFRQPRAAATVRGRSWAIHDGILGEPLEPIKLVKHLGHDARISTFDGPY